MALIKCPECKRMISEHAEKCPYCACPMEEIKLLMPNRNKNQHVENEVKCWFCEQRVATTTYKHTFVERQYYNTTMMRKRKTFYKDVTVPCCSQCMDSIESRGNYCLWFAIIGTVSVLVPFDYWMYTIESGLLIVAIVFEITFVGLVLFALFSKLGEYFWKITHRHLDAMLKKDIDEHQARKDLENYSRTHPLTRPTLAEFLGIK